MGRYHVLLSMLCPDHRHPDAPEVPFDTTTGGPIFGPFIEMASGRRNTAASKLLQALNGVLRELERQTLPGTAADVEWLRFMHDNHPASYQLMRDRCASGEGVVAAQPICPAAAGPYIAVWLVGFPHAAAVTGAKARLSVNMNLSLRSSARGLSNRQRGVRRTRHLIKGEMEAVRADRQPFEGGIVHKCTEVEIELHQFFHALYATDEELDEFVQWSTQHDEHAAANCRAATAEQLISGATNGVTDLCSPDRKRKDNTTRTMQGPADKVRRLCSCDQIPSHTQ